MIMVKYWRIYSMINQVTYFEKYRPKTLKEYVCDEQSRQKYQNIIDNNLSQHLLFGGEAGTGKTTLSEIICSSIDCDYLVVNGSEETSVDFVRDKIHKYITTYSFHSDLKVIIFDEMEYLSKNGQALLRKYMEDYIHLSRFILCCNEVDKVIPALKSRCSQIHMKLPKPSLVKNRLEHILKSENITYTDKTLNEYVNVFYTPDNDFRKVINEVQMNCINGNLMDTDVEINSDYKRFLDLFKKIDFNLEYVWKLDESELDEMKYLQRENRYLTIK